MSTPHDCACCPVGVASGLGKGQFCPFIEREYRQGAILYREGEEAGYAWFLQSGTIALRRGGSEELGLPGKLIGGAEALLGESYQATACVVSDARLCGATRDGLRQWVTGDVERVSIVLRGVLDVGRPAVSPIMKGELS